MKTVRKVWPVIAGAWLAAIAANGVVDVLLQIEAAWADFAVIGAALVGAVAGLIHAHLEQDSGSGDQTSGSAFEERGDAPHPPLGGTLEAPIHEPAAPSLAKRISWRIVGAVCLFGLLVGLFWLTDVLGWRRVVAGVSSVLLLIGVLMIRAPEMSRGDAIAHWRRQLRESDDPASSPEALAREVRAFWTLVGGVLVAIASVGLVVAIRGE